jgi:hypothetical protein
MSRHDTTIYYRRRPLRPHAFRKRSLPGLGTVLGARVLAEFGDDRTRYVDARARRNYAGTSPITKASGTRRVVLARFARNERLFNAYLWAFASLTALPGARAYCDLPRRRGKTHNQALRALANRLVAILHGCLRHQRAYEEAVAWCSESKWRLRRRKPSLLLRVQQGTAATRSLLA